MQTRRSIEQMFRESESSGLKPLQQGKDQFLPFAPVATAPRWYTTDEVANILHVTERGVGRFIRRGKLRASFVGRRHLISEGSLQYFIRSQERDFTEKASSEIQ